MKKYLYYLPIIIVTVCNSVITGFAQQLKIAVFDFDSMVHALPEYKNVDSLTRLFDDSAETAHNILYNKLVKIDSMFIHYPDFPDSNYIHLSDSIQGDRNGIVFSLAYWSDIVEKNRKAEIRRLSEPLYEKVNAAFEKVIKNRNYDLILKPNCIVACDRFDNIFIDVARELKLSSLPDNLIHPLIEASK